MKLFRASVVLAGLVGAYSISSCTQNDNKPQVVKVANAKTKETVDIERVELKKKEGGFVEKFERWLMWLDMAGDYLREEEINDPYLRLNFAHQEFLNTIMGHCNPLIPPETVLDKVTDEVKRVARSIVPPKRQKADFHVEPSKDQIEAFIKLINMADKVAPQVVLDDILSKIEKDAKVKGDSLEKIKESKDLASGIFKTYRKTFDDLSLENPRFIESVQRFHKDANDAGQAPYEPTWGLSLELLKSLKSIK